MARLIMETERDKKCYVDQHCGLERDQWEDSLHKTRTVYVGNLSFYTCEDQIHELFGKVGTVERVVMGLNRKNKKPCGFSFVEYATHEQAMAAFYIIKGAKLDGKKIQVDLDAGFQEMRQYGRGPDGGQWRDNLRPKFPTDPHRGGGGGGVLVGTNDPSNRLLYIGKRDIERDEGDARKKKRPRHSFYK